MPPLADLSLFGIDLSAGLALMDGQIALYLLFLKQFPGDDSAARLSRALTRGDAAEAFACAHTLKGLSAQLGLTRLCARSGELCDALRDSSKDALARAYPLLESVLQAREQAIRGIETLI